MTNTLTGPERGAKRARGSFAWASGTFIVCAVALFTLVGMITLFLLPRELIKWWAPTGVVWDEATAKSALTAAVQAVLFSLGGFIAIVGVGVSLSRHGQELRGAERQSVAHELDIETRLRERLITAVEMLSSRDAALQRTAGIYALAAIADEWILRERRDEAQICIDILCTYLRSTPPGETEGTSPEEIGVRNAGFAAIRAHLLPVDDDSSGVERWHGLNLDLSGARIDFEVNLSRVTLLDTRLQLSRLVLHGGGRLRMENVAVSAGGQLRLERASIAHGSRLDLRGARLSELGFIDMTRATLSDGSEIVIDRMLLQGKARLIMTRLKVEARSLLKGVECQIESGAHIILAQASFRGASRATMQQLTVSGAGSTLSAVGAILDRSSMDIGQAHVSTGGALVMRGISLNERSVLGLRSLSLSEAGKLEIPGAMVSGRSRIRCVGAEVSEQSAVNFEQGSLSDGSELVLSYSSFYHSRLSICGVEVKTSSRVLLNGADFEGEGLNDDQMVVDADSRYIR